MSLLKTNSIQIGQSTTGTNNFTLSVPSLPDGTIKLARGNSGFTTADIFSVNGSGAITGATISGATINSSILNGGSITLGTAVAATSGTSINYTGLPSWVKRVSVMFDGISISGNNYILVRLGTSSGYEATGYKSQLAITNTGSATANSTAGFIMHYNEAISTSSGTMTLSHMGNNLWTSSGTYSWTGSTNSTIMSGGSKQLGGVLDRIQILAANGTDTFDAGSVNIMYEG